MQTKTDPGQKAPGVFTSTIQSTLFLLVTLFPMYLVFYLAHEGGHALSFLSRGARVLLFYAHPFSMNGFTKASEFPAFWDYAAGLVVPFIISLPLFLFLWPRRSVAILPFVMVFPWVAFNAIGRSDFNRIVKMTGWPAWPIFALLSILIVVGVFLLVSVFPLLGLEPKDKRVFFVAPAGFLLYAVVGLMVAYLCVPGSRADVQFGMREYIISQAEEGLFKYLIFGVIFALFYFTLYRVIERRLPVWLRTEKRKLVWRDLLIPGILSVLSIVVGILIIR